MVRYMMRRSKVSLHRVSEITENSIMGPPFAADYIIHYRIKMAAALSQMKILMVITLRTRSCISITLLLWWIEAHAGLLRSLDTLWNMEV